MQATACITGSYYASITCRFAIRPDACHNACELAAGKEIVVTSQACNLLPS